MMSQADINTCKMNDILALLKPNCSDFERAYRRMTGFWFPNPTSREIDIEVAVCLHLIDRINRPWWQR